MKQLLPLELRLKGQNGLQEGEAMIAGIGAGMFLLNLAILGFAGYGVYKFATKKKKGR